MLAFRFVAVSCFSLLSWPAVALAAPPEEAGPVPVDEPVGAAPDEQLAAESAPVEDAPTPEVEGVPTSKHEPHNDVAHGEVVEDVPEEPVDPRKAIGPKHSIQYLNLLAPRANPLGLEERLWIGYQYRLYTKSSDLFRGSNLGVFLRPILSPAIGLIGPTVQFQPLAILRFRATFSFVGWLGTFDYMQSYQSPHDDFSDTRLDEQTIAGENYPTIGHQTELEMLLQIRFKGLVLRNTFVADYNSMNLRGDDDVYYDIRIDAMVPNKGWVLVNDTDLMWITDFKGPRHNSLLTGARATVTKSFYPDSVYEVGDVKEDPNGPMLRVGPVIGYVFYDRPDKRPRFNKPTLLLIPQWNILHRWRTGRDVSVGYPTISLAFVFSGQLWGSDGKPGKDEKKKSN